MMTDLFDLLGWRRKRRPPVKKASCDEQLRSAAKDWLPQRTLMLAERYGFPVKRIFIKNNRSNWGSCSSLGNINLNLNLMRLEVPLRDFVILHELAHLRHLNHGTEFHTLLEQLCADHFPPQPEAKEILQASSRSRARYPISHTFGIILKKKRPF